jgi:hypothetical protein
MLRIEQLGPATFISFDPQATTTLEKPTVATLLLSRLSCRELVAVTYLTSQSHILSLRTLDKDRADERTRTAYSCSLRVITQALRGVAYSNGQKH